jgi:type VI secretion system protein VasD
MYEALVFYFKLNSPYNPVIRIILTVVFILLLSNCSFGQKEAPLPAPVAPKPIIISVELNAGKNLNPDIEGRASPVVVRIYQLQDIATFNNSDFFALYENDQALIGKDIKYREELEIKPDQTLNKQFELQAGSRYLVVFAAFRDLDNAQWKAIAEFKPQENPVFKFTLDNSNLILAH